MDNITDALYNDRDGRLIKLLYSDDNPITIETVISDIDVAITNTDAKSTLLILDKLAMSDAINAIINSHAAPSDTQIINHTLSNNQIIIAHTQKYNVLNNDTITAIPTNMNNLRIKKMIVRGYSLKNKDLPNLPKNIEELDIQHCLKITTCTPFATTLRKLSISSNDTNIDDKSLSKCTAIEHLHITSNTPKISTCAPFAKSLKTLSISKVYYEGKDNDGDFSYYADYRYRYHDTTETQKYYYEMTDDGLSKCTSLTELNIHRNIRVTTCDPFARTLRKLIISDTRGLSDIGLAQCNAIEELNINNTCKITTCAPFAKSLRKLSARNCSMANNGIRDCASIEELDISGNINITTCEPFAKSLKVLRANSLAFGCYSCNLTDAGLKFCTSIEELNISYNLKITTCEPFAKSLRKLYACGDAVISSNKYMMGDTGLVSCNQIVELYASYNQYITTCAPFAKSLKKLVAEGKKCGITDDGLRQCINIELLDTHGNTKITTCAPFAKSLRMLNTYHTTAIAFYPAIFEWSIPNSGLNLCTSITKLNISNNDKISTCAPFAKSLRILNASNISIMNDDGLRLCTSIVELNMWNNNNITTCAPFAKSLRILNIASCSISDNGLRECDAIENLNAQRCKYITTCNPFAKTLRVLDARGNDCGISDGGLRLCTSIEKLYARHNPRITTCAPFANTLRTLTTDVKSDAEIISECKYAEMISIANMEL